MKRLFTPLVLCIFSVFSLGSYVGAQTNSVGLTVEPTLELLQAEPGQQVETSFTATNAESFSESERPTVTYSDFKPGIGGQPEIVENGTYAFGASAWLNGTLGLTNLGEGDINTIDVFVDVPADAEPGAYSAIVRVGQNSSTDEQTITSSLGAILIINVGSSEPAAEIVDGPNTFVDEGAEVFSVEIRNTSQHYFRPFIAGALSVTSSSGFGFSTIAFDDGGIFPGTSRVYLADLSEEDLDRDGERAYSVTVSSGADVLGTKDVVPNQADVLNDTFLPVEEPPAEEEAQEEQSEVIAAVDSDESSILPYVAIGLLVLFLGLGSVGYFIAKAKRTKALPAAATTIAGVLPHTETSDTVQQVSQAIAPKQPLVEQPPAKPTQASGAPPVPQQASVSQPQPNTNVAQNNNGGNQV